MTRNKFRSLYPKTGSLSRSKYPRHLEFFAGGKEFNERALLGGNRSGKSIAGNYETVCHLTGKYPKWWGGRVFTDPVNGWSCGDTSKTVREIAQTILLGPPGQPALQGTGLIPGDLIINTTTKQGIADAVETIRVKHVNGGTSTLTFKAYEQGRESFQGTSQELIHLDEECPMEIYTECLLRTMTVAGIIYLTATPLEGLTEIMLYFLPHLQPITEEPSAA